MFRTSTAVAALVLFALAGAPSAGQDMSNVTIKIVPVAGNVYMLQGKGGNIGVSVGQDGAFLIDDQFAPLTEKILAAVAELTDEPVRFVVNTHWHPDHVGGNENLGQAGAVVVAHENVRRRMSTEQFIEAFNSRVSPSPQEALPVITFADTITFHWNDDELNILHVESAHTDGDAIVHFRGANVVHMGDTYFDGMYPFIDVGSGGTIAGLIAAADGVLALTNRRTKIIPGHGPLSDAAGLRAYREMLDTVRTSIQELIDEGKTRDQVIAAAPTRDLDEKWGQGFMKPDVWVGIVYDGMVD